MILNDPLNVEKRIVNMNDNDEKCLLCEECYSVDDDSDSTAYGKCVRCNDLN